MKKNIKHYLLASKYVLLCLSCVTLIAACSRTEELSESIIKEPTDELTELDFWLMDNYQNPFNVEFRYKWNSVDNDISFDYTPADYNKSVVVAKVLKHTFVDVVSESCGIHFTRGFLPRVIQLVGTAKYTTGSTGTVTTATTTAGMKITLNLVNRTPAKPTIGWLTDNWLKTVYHECTHALHQKKPYPEAFKRISNMNYVGDDWNATNNTLDIAYKLGFVSRYARNNSNEDFVETFAYYVTRYRPNAEYGDDWNAILTKAGPEGAAIIQSKLDMVRDYLRTTWDINMDDLRETLERHADTLESIDYTTLN